MFGPEIIASASETRTTKIGAVEYDVEYDVEYAVEAERMAGCNDMLVIFNGYEKRNTRIPLEHLDSLLNTLLAVQREIMQENGASSSPTAKPKDSSHAS